MLLVSSLGLSQNAFSAAAEYSYIKGKVVSFDAKKVKLQVGAKTVYVNRNTVDEKNLKVGNEVQSKFKTPYKINKKKK